MTSDPTISGVINSPREIASFQGRFLSNEQQEFRELIALVAEDGSFSLDQAKLTEINHSSLPDGNYTLELIAADLEGKQSEIIQLDFTLDTAAPSLFLETPIRNSNHSKNPRIIGSIPDQLEQIAAVEYQLDGATPLTLHLDQQGRFDSPLPTTTIGTHSLVLTAIDTAGNQTEINLEFQLTEQILIGPENTTGWGITNNDTVFLAERDSFLVQATKTIELGQTQGTRTLQFDLDANFANSDTSAFVPDALWVYLLDPDNPSQTLLDNGTPGTPFFSLSSDTAEYTPGLVLYHGNTVELDLSPLAEELADFTHGLLQFQLVNQDGDTGSTVKIHNWSNTVDEQGITPPIFPMDSTPLEPGPALNLSNLNLGENLELFWQNQQLDGVTGNYSAQVTVKTMAVP